MKPETQHKDPHVDMHLTSLLNKEIMSEIRKGDYQHPGEEEAIEMIFDKISKKSSQLLLDVGCGRGGTATYLQSHGWGNVIGVDINEAMINVANKSHGEEPFPCFFHSDVLDLSNSVKKHFNREIKFDVIYLLNSFFLFPNQTEALSVLKSVAHDKTKLIVFDYVDYGEYLKNPYKENGKLFLPNCIPYSAIKTIFKKAGWKINSIINMDEEYLRWYEELIKKIESYRDHYSKKYGKENFDYFENRYRHIYESYKNKILGAVTIYAEV